MQEPPSLRHAVIALAVFCLLPAFQEAVHAQAKIEFEETVYNWGRLLEGESVTHAYRFWNRGDEPLEILGVGTTCGCTAALVTDSLLAPGEQGEITVTFDSRARMGNQSKTVYVATNDPEQKTVELKIEGEVYTYVRVNPSSLNFGEVEVGTSRTMTVTVTPWSGTRLEITELESPSIHFGVRTLKVVDAWKRLIRAARKGFRNKFVARGVRVSPRRKGSGEKPVHFEADVENSVSISVTLLPTAPLGQHSGRLTIHTGVEEKPMVMVPVHASVVGDLKVTPKHHNFGSVTRGEIKEATFYVTSRKGKPFRITSVKCSSPHASAGLSEVSPGKEYEIRLGILPDVPVGQLQGSVTARTTDRDEPEIEVKFYARVIE